MSNFVLVKGEVGQAVGTVGGAAAGATRGAALGSVIPVVGTALGGLVGGLMGARTGGKVGDALTGGEAAQADNVSAANKQNQQNTREIKELKQQLKQQNQMNQMDRNVQMADRAKQRAEIKTGEPMEMSWRLLKDWSWNHELSPRARRAIVERARKAKKKQQYSHIHPVPSRHHDDQFAERYHPHQKMPQDAAGLEPHEVAGAMADLFLENHPELKQALEEELPHPADPNRTNTPGMVFHALSTDAPIISDNTSWNTYSPVIAKPNMFAKPMVHTAVNSPISQASNRHTIRVSTVQDYPHSHARHNEILPSKFNLVDPLSHLGNTDEPVEAAKLRRDYRIRQLGAGEEKWRNKILDVEGEKSDKIEQDIITQLGGQSRVIEQRDAEEAKQFEAQQAKEQAREQQLAAKEQGELQVKAGPMPGIYYVTDPAFGFEEEMITQGNPNVGQGYDYYHNHYQNQQTVQTGEPMDLAWRMLKEEDSYDKELASHEQLWNDEADKDLQGKTDELFDYAIAQGVDPDELLDAWHDRASMVEGLDYGEPGSELGFRAHAVDPSQWKKLASEPMGLAWRMLKQMSDEEMQEWAYENLRNQGITIPDEREEEVVPKPEIPTLYY